MMIDFDRTVDRQGSDVETKAAAWFDAGACVVLVVDPQLSTIRCYRSAVRRMSASVDGVAPMIICVLCPAGANTAARADARCSASDVWTRVQTSCIEPSICCPSLSGASSSKSARVGNPDPRLPRCGRLGVLLVRGGVRIVHGELVPISPHQLRCADIPGAIAEFQVNTEPVRKGFPVSCD